MKRKLFAIILSGMFSASGLLAQSIVHNPTELIKQDITSFFNQQNYNATSIFGNLPFFDAPQKDDEQIEYLKTLATLRTDEEAPAELIQAYLERYPVSAQRQSAMLTLGNIYLSRGDYDRAEFVFRDIDPNGLDANERTQWGVQWAYALMKHYKVIPGRTNKNNEYLKQARNLLQLATEGQDPWAARALIYLVAIDMTEKNLERAEKVLLQTRWPEELVAESELYKVLIVLQKGNYQQGVEKAERLKNRSPELRNRAALLSGAGQAYFNLKDYKNTIANLSALEHNSHYKLSPSEGYALGVAYYESGSYANSIKPLGAATSAGHELSSPANLYRGIAFGKTGDVPSAIAALEAVTKNAQAPLEYRETALYNMAVIQRQSGVSNFGQAVKTAERFLNEFEQSPRRKSMAGMLTEAFFTSKDYETSLLTIQRIKKPTPSILEAKQYVLCKLAEKEGMSGRSAEQMAWLNQAVSTENHGDYYREALLRRANLFYDEQNYNRAEQDILSLLRTPGLNSEEKSSAYYLLGYSRYNQNRYPEAYDAFREYNALNTGNTEFKADVLCRMGDCMYVQRKMDEAISLYNRANGMTDGGLPDALIRLADIYNLKKDYNKQISILNQLLVNHANTPFAAEALYQKGRAAIVGHLPSNEAEQAFNTVKQKYPDTKWARLSGIDLALLYYNQGKPDKAIEAYKNIIRQYKYSDEAHSALSDLKSICLEQDRVEDYTAFVSTLGKDFSPSAAENAHLRFLAAENNYRKNSANAKNTLVTYLQDYEQSQDAPKAWNYLARIYEQEGDTDNALACYNRLNVSGAPAELRSEALLKIGDIQFGKKNYAESYDAYSALSKLSIGTELRSAALLGIAKNGVETSNEKEVLKAAESLFAITPLNKDTEKEMLLYRGKAYESSGNPEKAIADYKRICDDTDTEIGAEALVRSVSLQYDKGQKKEARKRIESFIKKSSPQQYWLARAFILLSDIYERDGDSYTAKQYIESLKENFGGKNKEIDQMIEQRLANLTKE